MTQHHFSLTLRATPQAPGDERTAKRLGRRHVVESEGKPPIEGSSAVAFFGEVERWNPEELFLAALAQCHYLSYLFVAERAGLVVRDYRCGAQAILEVEPSGAGQIVRVTLTPEVSVDLGMGERARQLHHEAHELCFIARSVACEVSWDDTVVEVSPPDTQH